MFSLRNCSKNCFTRNSSGLNHFCTLSYFYSFLPLLSFDATQKSTHTRLYSQHEWAPQHPIAKTRSQSQEFSLESLVIWWWVIEKGNWFHFLFSLLFHFYLCTAENCHCPNWYGCIMSESIVGQDGIQPYRFSDCSRSSYLSSINQGHAMCLQNKPNSVKVCDLLLFTLRLFLPIFGPRTTMMCTQAKNNYTIISSYLFRYTCMHTKSTYNSSIYFSLYGLSHFPVMELRHMSFQTINTFYVKDFHVSPSHVHKLSVVLFFLALYYKFLHSLL